MNKTPVTPDTATLPGRALPAMPAGRGRRAALRSLRQSPLLWGLAMAVTALLLLPIVYLLLRAADAGPATWAMLGQPRILAVAVNSLALAAGVTLGSALIAVPLAWLTVRSDLPGRTTWAVLAALPLVIPSYVAAYLMVSALGPRGIVQQWLEPLLGIQRLPSIYGFPGALFVLTLLCYPYTFLSVRAALLRLDPAQEEASRSLGLGAWPTFWRVTLPQLRPALAAGSLLVVLYCLRDFGAVSILRFDTFTRVIYVQYQSAFDRTAAAVLSLVLVVLTLVILAAEMRTRGRARFDRAGAGVARRAPQVSLGRWRWLALFGCAVLVGLALVLPTAVLGFWLVRGLAAGVNVAGLGSMTANSLTAAGLAALATMAAALPVTWLAARRPSRGSHMLEQLAYLGYALPGIVVALALVFFATRAVPPLYQTWLLLIVAYVILFLPQATGALRSALLQVHPSVEEAARSLGRSPGQVVWSITLPLVRPGVAAALALVFLTTIKELPATLILGPLDFKTLATSIWTAVSEAYFAQAAVPALLLILLSSVPMALLMLDEQGFARRRRRPSSRPAGPVTEFEVST